MGGELASDSPPEGGGETAPISLSKLFWNCLPFYLSIGMTADEYWNKDPKLCRAYFKAFQITERRKNIDLWKQGLYMYNAICAVAPALHAFAKDPKPSPYLSEPIPFTQREQKEYEENKRKQEAQAVKDQLTAWAIDHNKRWKEEKNGE